MSGRKPNWTLEEVEQLVEGVQDNHDIIKAKFSTIITSDKKTQCWKKIADRVNSVNVCAERTVRDVKKKWQDLQCQTKKKEAFRLKELRQTGGRPPPDELKPWEQKIRNTLSKTVLNGIPGGFDSSETGTEYAVSASPAPGGLKVFKTEAMEELPVEPIHVDVEHLSAASCTSESATLSRADEDSLSEYADEGKGSKKRKRTNHQESLEVGLNMFQHQILAIEKEKLEVMRQNLVLEERKVKALENISNLLQQHDATNSTASISVLPLTGLLRLSS